MEGSPIEQRARFDRIRYSNCWEDADVLCEALQPLEGARVLSVLSGGDNSLALAAEGARVVAADLSPAQVAIGELRRAAFRRLDHDGVLRFLGVRPDPGRMRTYARLEGDLPAPSRAFWRSRPEAVGRGVIHAGRFERYLRLFRRWVLPTVHAEGTIRGLLAERSRDERVRFYESAWDTPRWRLLFKVFFGRVVMGRLGRDPEFFRYVEGPVAERILERVRYALTELPTHTNPFLQYILSGNYGPSLPRYLEPGRFDAVRAGVDRMVLVEGAVEEAGRAHAGGGFDAFNLSDIFEYMGPGESEESFRRLVAVARPGARLAYWNMLAPRRCDGPGVEPLEALSARLFRRDRAFFYSAFHVDRVRP